MYDKAKHLKRAWGLSLDDFDSILFAQGGGCAVCESPTPNSKKGWSIDHCHATGKMRGIVCHHCNIALGHAKDSPSTLRKLALYLEEHARV